MRRTGMGVMSAVVVLILLGIGILPVPTYGAILYKSYTVQTDRGTDILCDPYHVEKNDYVYKLFRQRGEISEKDFPEFLSIFKRLNPHIRNIDRIHPGQQILIPLKKLERDALPGQASGIVTIPFITLTNVTELLKKYAYEHKVEPGDSVSVLVSRRYVGYGSRVFQNGMRLFKLMNPSVKDINHILPGQHLLLPDPALRQEPWYPSLLDPAGKISKQAVLSGLNLPEEEASQDMADQDDSVVGFSRAATLLEGQLVGKGRYFFPRQGKKDLELDLSRVPVIMLKNGMRIIFAEGNTISEPDMKTVTSYWPNAVVAPISPTAPFDRVLNAISQLAGKKQSPNSLSFSDRGLVVKIQARWVFEEPALEGQPTRYICVTPIENPDERTPESILRYLSRHNIVLREDITGADDNRGEDPSPHLNTTVKDGVIAVSDSQALVAELLERLGYAYSRQGDITFPYAGIQVQTVANIVLRENGSPLLVDFGDFNGEAVLALAEAGFDIILMKAEDDHHTVTLKLLRILGVTFSENPTFPAVERQGVNNTSLTVPGFLIPGVGTSSTLISTTPLADEVVEWMEARELKTIVVDMGKFDSPQAEDQGGGNSP
ncbi:MAG: LysM peptidoglycan-binding domain-containing protein [Desulfobacterales bacterium]